MPHGSGLEKALFTGLDMGAQGLEPTRDSELILQQHFGFGNGVA